MGITPSTEPLDGLLGPGKAQEQPVVNCAHPTWVQVALVQLAAVLHPRDG